MIRKFLFAAIFWKIATTMQIPRANGNSHTGPLSPRSSNSDRKSKFENSTALSDLGCPTTPIEFSSGLSTCGPDKLCVDGLLCCPTQTGNVRVCRKSQAESKFRRRDFLINGLFTLLILVKLVTLVTLVTLL